MDAVFQKGEDIQEIYDELSQILIKDHLEITKVNHLMHVKYYKSSL